MFDRPVLVYDGECPFCTFWVARWQQRAGDRVIYAPFQEAHDSFPQISRRQFERSVYLVLPGGAAYHGAEAVFRLLEQTSRLGRVLLWLYRRMPGFARISEWCYSFVAAHRPFFFRFTRLFFHEDRQALLGLSWSADIRQNH